MAPRSLDELEPLWLTLKRHHGAVHAGRSRPRRRGLVGACAARSTATGCAEEGAFVLVARAGRPRGRLRARAPARPEPDLGRAGALRDRAGPRGRRGRPGRRHRPPLLIDRVHDESGCDDVELVVLDANEPAMRFYERLGFTPGP